MTRPGNARCTQAMHHVTKEPDTEAQSASGRAVCAGSYDSKCGALSKAFREFGSTQAKAIQ